MTSPVSPDKPSILENFGPHVLLSCNQEGAVLEVLVEGLGLEPGRLLFDFVAKESRGRTLDFLLEVKRQGLAGSGQINLITPAGPVLLFLAGVALTDSFLIFGAPTARGVEAWLAHMRAFPGDDKSRLLYEALSLGEDHLLYDEFTRLNNELINLQRQLAKQNVELEKRVKERTAKLEESEERLQHLTFQLLSAQEEERHRLSRELHDELGQSLIVLKLQLKTLARDLGSKEAKVKSAFEQLSTSVDDTIESVRRLSRDLSPSILEDLGLMAALRNLFAGVEEHYQLTGVTAGLDDLDQLFSREARINIYRVFQESLTNIAKHARPTQVTVTARRQNRQVTFAIEDNGAGFDVQEIRRPSQKKRGMGLAAMEERVRLLGGTFHLESQPGRGTRISFTLPVSAEGRQHEFLPDNLGG
jgi:signal transduction histidine kinase